MKGIIGKKLGMMSYFDANGKSVGCTVIEAGPCVVTQIKTNDTDGYSAMQIAFEEKKEKYYRQFERSFRQIKHNS